jgi:LysR family transcriptional regulator, cyn operon transcriptional activator
MRTVDTSRKTGAIQTLRFALLAPGFATRTAVDAWCQKQRFTPNIVLEANSIAILLKVAKQGRMATILPDAIVREQAGLRELQTTHLLPSRTAALLRRKNGYQSVASDAFAKLASGFRARM